jgi:hypothetical protein
VVTLGTSPTGVLTVGVVTLGTETFTEGVGEASTDTAGGGGLGVGGGVGAVTLIGVGVGADVTGVGPAGVGLELYIPDSERPGRPAGAVVAGAEGAGAPLAVLLRGGAIWARGFSRPPRRRRVAGRRPCFAFVLPARVKVRLDADCAIATPGPCWTASLSW